MRDVAAGLVALLVYGAAFVKLGAVRRQQGARAPRALFLTLLTLALGWTFLFGPVARAVERGTGVDLLSQLLADCLALATGCGTQAMLVYLTHDEQAGRRMMRPRLVALAAAVALMTAVFFAYSPAARTDDLPADYGSSAFYLAYSAPYLAYLAYIFVGITRLCWQSAKQARPVPFLASGLRLIAAGGTVGLLYVALRVGYISVARTSGSNRHGDTYGSLSDLTVAVVTVLVVVGATLPSWAPQIARYRDVRQLTPLWRALINRHPEIAIEPYPSATAELLPVDVPRRRNRRVIEILDGRLELRQRLRPAVAHQARELATEQGVRGQDVVATVEAAQIAVALHDSDPATGPDTRPGPGPGAHVLPDTPLAAAEPAPPGDVGDLQSEVAWLRKVSRAFTRSPVVTDVLARQVAPPGQPPRRSAADIAARVITELTAPAPVLVALLLTTGGTSGRTATSGLGWGLLAAVFFSIAPFAGIVWGVVRGRLTDHHVSQRTQRPLVIVLALASFVAGVLVMTAGGAPEELIAVMAALLAAAVVCLLVTLTWKISMHMAVAGCAAALLPSVLGPRALLIWPALVAVGWSRVHLRDHTPAQTAAGALLGAAVAGVAFATLQ